MIRALTRLAAVALFAFAPSAVDARSTPVLRASVLVSDDLVRIGDLADHVPAAKARIAVFRSPDLGETGGVSAAKVLNALRAHDVVGVATGGVSEIAVTRASRIVGGDEIRGQLAALLAPRLRGAAPADIELAFEQPLPAIHLDPAADLAIAHLTFEPRHGRFQVEFRAGGTRVRLSGVAAELCDTVVLTRPLARGEIVHAADVAVERRPKAERQGDAVTDPAAAIGLSVRQPMQAGQPLRRADLTKPLLVQRGEAIVLVYEAPGITLTARGKAEESGSAGDTVNVLNTQSKRVVQGVVTGPGQVTVISLTPRITAAAANLASVQSHTGAARRQAE